MPDEMDAFLLPKWKRWLAARPAAIRAAALAYPPDCYRHKTQPLAHYLLLAYEEPEGDGPVTARVEHGADSFMAGFEVFGMPLSDLVRCGCGNWQWASQEEQDVSIRKADAYIAAKEAPVAVVSGKKGTA